MPVIYSPLSDSELDSVCLSLVNQDLPYFSAFHEAFVLLYLTGCRVTELFQITSWERVSGYEMRFLPHKGNYHRNVTLDSRCDSFIDAVVGQYKPFGGLSSGQLNSVFYNFSEYSNFKVGTKPVSLYLFRYNFIRRLFNDGLNINQIADKMGYTSTTVVGGYLTAEIEKGFFLDTDGFVNINGTWWAQNMLNWSDGGTDIRLFDTFNDGNLCGYYRSYSVNRFLSINPQFRLPSVEDFQALFVYLVSCGYSGMRSLLLPNNLYWNQVYSSMVNAFGFNGRGFGSSGGTSVFRRKEYLYILVNPVVTGSYSSAQLDYYSNALNIYTTADDFFMPTRLILDL